VMLRAGEDHMMEIFHTVCAGVLHRSNEATASLLKHA